MRKLAVFRGGCTRDAAADVAGASLAVLATLVDKSLLRRTRTGRYDLHELIRQYALAKLAEDPQEHVATRDQHSAYYAAWLKQRERPLKGAQQAAMVAELSVEIDNIRAAWAWGSITGDCGTLSAPPKRYSGSANFGAGFRKGRHSSDTQPTH